MTTAMTTMTDVSPLKALRRARWTQAMTLMIVADASIGSGILMMVLHPAGWAGGFVSAVGMEFAIWGAINLVFAALGIVQSSKVARTPMTLQAEIDELAAGESLLRTLRFNHKLNLGYLLIAVALLAWAQFAQSPVLAGHGVGVAVQGGFLLLFDWWSAGRLMRVLGLNAAGGR